MTSGSKILLNGTSFECLKELRMHERAYVLVFSAHFDMMGKYCGSSGCNRKIPNFQELFIPNGY